MHIFDWRQWPEQYAKSVESIAIFNNIVILYFFRKSGITESWKMIIILHNEAQKLILERILSRIILPLSQFHVSLVILSINNSLLKKTPHLRFS